MTSISLLEAPTEELWRSPSALGHVYGSEAFAEALSGLEIAADFEDLTSTHSTQVNTATSGAAPISGWLRYREGYSPDLVTAVLRRDPLTADTILLDPMCGSGSSLVGAQRVGVPAVGFDVSPYATLATRVKTNLLQECELAKVRDWLGRLSVGGKGSGAERPVDEILAPYFPSSNFRVLQDLRAEVEVWDPGPIRDFLTLALLAILEDCSNRRKDGNGLATRPSKISEPDALFERKVGEMAVETAAERASRSSFASTEVELLSAIGFHGAPETKRLGLPGRVGGIVFSPPYPNSFDYFESYKLELLFTGLVHLDEFGSRRRDLVRSFRQSGTSEPREDMPLVEGLVQEVVDAIPRKEARTGARDSRTRLVPNLLRGYFADMRAVLESCAAVMAPAGRVHVVVDQSAYAGVPVPTDLLLADLGNQVGLELERLTLCRRAKTSGQQLQLQPRLSALLRETIVTMRKRSS